MADKSEPAMTPEALEAMKAARGEGPAPAAQNTPEVPFGPLARPGSETVVQIPADLEKTLGAGTPLTVKTY